MVRTQGGSRLRPRVRFSTPEQAEQALASAAVPEPLPEPVLEEPQGFRRYQTRMGPRAPSPVPQRLSRRARPSKRARTSGPGESSSSRPQPSQSPSAAEATSSPQLSPASRIRRPLFVGTPITGNVGLQARDFHGVSYYDVPALTADPRFRDSVATPKPDPTRKASPNRNPGTLGLFLLVIVLFNFYFQKCRGPNPRPDPNGGSEPEPGLIRRFHLSYQNIFINSFSCGNSFSFGASP